MVILKIDPTALSFVNAMRNCDAGRSIMHNDAFLQLCVTVWHYSNPQVLRRDFPDEVVLTDFMQIANP